MSKIQSDAVLSDAMRRLTDDAVMLLGLLNARRGIFTEEIAGWAWPAMAQLRDMKYAVIADYPQETIYITAAGEEVLKYARLPRGGE